MTEVMLIVLACCCVLLASTMPGSAASALEAVFQGQRETWDYAPAMREVAGEFKGKQGVVLHFGDSITFASPYSAWAQRGKGKTAEDEAILRWSHCGENDDLDGWYLASHPVGEYWSYTAASGIRADQFLVGGYAGMPSSADIIAKYNPQIAIVMLGANDAWSGMPTADYIKSMEAIIGQLLANGTVPILSTIPPMIPAPQLGEEYKAALWKLAEQHRLPVLDFYGEIVARGPNGSWNGTILNEDDPHPTDERAGVTPESEPTPANLRESGYLLRGWLSVKKLEEVRERVWGTAARTGAPQSKESTMAHAAFTKAESPRVAMLWTPIRGTARDSVADWARHDLVMVSPGQIGMVWDRQPEGLAEGFTPESVEEAKKKVAELRRLNPDIVILADNSFYEYDDDSLPEDHPWWLRVNGEREQFWPGTHRMDWYNPDYQAHVIRRSEAIMQVDFDGLFFDNLRDEPGPWIAILGELRKRLGDDILLQANVGYDIDAYDFAAPFLNGFMYESGWSHNRTEWDDCIKAMQHSVSLMREPHINLIERFEETEGHAGWPGHDKRGHIPERDPAARRWSLCYALTIGDYYYLFSDNTSHRHDWYPEYDVKIGLPTEPGARINSHVWQRMYEKAVVVVNLPGAVDSYTVDMARPTRDAFTGERGTRFAIPPGDGRILVFE